MKVVFYTFTKRENSTKIPTGGTSYDCQLKGPTSVLAPVITLKMGAGANPSGFNMAYISDFKRYYFISDIVTSGYNWEIQCNVDALASWKSQIGSSTQYILRSSHSFDGSIMDNLYPTKEGITFTREAGTNPWSTDLTHGLYVLGIINNDVISSMGSVRYYVCGGSTIDDIMTALFDSSSGNFLAGFVDGDSDLTTSVYTSLFNPLQYINSCTFFPLSDLPVDPNLRTGLPFGYWTLDDVTGFSWLASNPVKTVTGSIDLPVHPQAASRGEYLRLSPYTRYLLDFRPFGQIPLDPTYLTDSDKLYYSIRVDAIGGAGVLQLFADSAMTQFIGAYTAQVGVPIQLAQMTRDYVGAASSVVSGAISTAAGALTGGVAGAITGGISAIGSTANSLMPQMQSKGANGSLAEFQVTPTITGSFLPLVDEDNADRGRPLCKKAVISNYPGYLTIADPDITLPSTAQENTTIKSYMAGGFYYE